MKKIIQNIKDYFIEKEENKASKVVSPVGVCPICWGHSEWDDEYYDIKKDKHKIPGGDVYESFISKIVDKHVNNTHKHDDKYICTSCDKEI